MAELDHASAMAVLLRFVSGASVAEDEVEGALAHAAACERCLRELEAGGTPACTRFEDDLPDAAPLLARGEDAAGRHPELAAHLTECERCTLIVAELAGETQAGEPGEVDVPAVFERGLTLALSGPDPIARRRAAEQLAVSQRVGPAALEALAVAAARDPEALVRSAALRALDALDEAVSIPERVIEAWSAWPAEAAGFIAGVLERLSGEPAREGITRLEASGAPGERLEVSGHRGIHGTIAEEEDGLWLTLEGLPSELEDTTPLVAVPTALEESAPPAEWPGERPGLVPASEPVAGGSIRLRLVKHPPADKAALFREMYLLTRAPA